MAEKPKWQLGRLLEVSGDPAQQGEATELSALPHFEVWVYGKPEMIPSWSLDDRTPLAARLRYQTNLRYEGRTLVVPADWIELQPAIADEVAYVPYREWLTQQRRRRVRMGR